MASALPFWSWAIALAAIRYSKAVYFGGSEGFSHRLSVTCHPLRAAFRQARSASPSSAPAIWVEASRLSAFVLILSIASIVTSPAPPSAKDPFRGVQHSVVPKIPQARRRGRINPVRIVGMHAIRPDPDPRFKVSQEFETLQTPLERVADHFMHEHDPGRAAPERFIVADFQDPAGARVFDGKVRCDRLAVDAHERKAQDPRPRGRARVKGKEPAQIRIGSHACSPALLPAGGFDAEDFWEVSPDGGGGGRNELEFHTPDALRPPPRAPQVGSPAGRKTLLEPGPRGADRQPLGLGAAMERNKALRPCDPSDERGVQVLRGNASEEDGRARRADRLEEPEPGFRVAADQAAGFPEKGRADKLRSFEAAPPGDREGSERRAAAGSAAPAPSNHSYLKSGVSKRSASPFHSSCSEERSAGFLRRVTVHR